MRRIVVNEFMCWQHAKKNTIETTTSFIHLMCSSKLNIFQRIFGYLRVIWTSESTQKKQYQKASFYTFLYKIKNQDGVVSKDRLRAAVNVKDSG